MTDDPRGTSLIGDDASDRGLGDLCIVHVGRRICGSGAGQLSASYRLSAGPKE